MTTIDIRDTEHWAALLRTEPRRPVLVHLNGDTTWLLQLPCPPSGGTRRRRSHFNLLIDPWLHGPQSDVAPWFSTQRHVVAPAVPSLAALQALLRELDDDPDAAAGNPEPDGDPRAMIHAVAVSHEFTDHCHRATLQELPRDTPVYAADAAAELIRSWHFFDAVTTAPGLLAGTPWRSLPGTLLPAWLRVGRLVTPGNSLYYHSALVVAFDLGAGTHAEAVVYSPHGVAARDLSAALAGNKEEEDLAALAVLHGLHDVRLAPFVRQLNLGALNGVEAVRAARARYWVGTHDEEKKGRGLIAPLLRRTRYTLRHAVAHDEKRRSREAGGGGREDEEPGYVFKELASGEALLLK
ncbi:hypothetical protein ISF_01380 [Cordyceps fumosorosea ARSEF 2679]|uniref:Uncharacterized protein n=1 Tax=Cordyceps fumosorosea (strain ARSEF 2679) TaxID=1081104 RepID=A0A168D937_CORFA|nr:hypothetical protein ISF_01380 [Cordyceps fumosorosea ARSEF 2679]OAA72307.1 hypothetical protein ISF_01380 [Cordyceps fumosorosea ARSEF 2679]